LALNAQRFVDARIAGDAPLSIACRGGNITASLFTAVIASPPILHCSIANPHRAWTGPILTYRKNTENRAISYRTLPETGD